MLCVQCAEAMKAHFDPLEKIELYDKYKKHLSREDWLVKAWINLVKRHVDLTVE